jgi:DNA-binding protein H-NS
MVMKRTEIKSLSVDELWALYEATIAALSEKMIAEKNLLDERLKRLARKSVKPTGKTSKRRRPYPTVLPKFRNPEKPSETWAGRGKQPRWVTSQLRSGKRMDDFRIKRLTA